MGQAVKKVWDIHLDVNLSVSFKTEAETREEAIQKAIELAQSSVDIHTTFIKSDGTVQLVRTNDWHYEGETISAFNDEEE